VSAAVRTPERSAGGRRAGRDTRDAQGRGRGQALVEFALAVPIFLLILFGLVDVGRLVYINNAASEAARDGARWGTVAGRSADSTTWDQIETTTIGRTTAIPQPTATVSCISHGTPRTDGHCYVGDILVVRLTAPVSLVTPGISQLIGPVTVTATARVAVSS